MTLREQTIGRGLRLPYGKRTGHNKADKLTIVAHDRFQEIIDEANKPDSIIRKENIIEINPAEISRPKEVVTSVSQIEKKFIEEQERIDLIAEPEEKQKAQISLEVHKTLVSILPELSDNVKSVAELTRGEIKQAAIEKVRERIESTPQQKMFIMEMIAEIEKFYDEIVSDFTKNIIELPRIVIQQSNQMRSYFRDFDLDTSRLNYQPVSEEILRRTLRGNETDIVIGQGRIVPDIPENIIVNELINYDGIDYNETADLLFKIQSESREEALEVCSYPP